MIAALGKDFEKALAKLSEQERKQVKVTVFDVQMDPTGAGLSLHRIDRSPDPNFWSARVNRDLRLILHKTKGSTLIAYVGHHDDAYAWAERRRIEEHPTTRAIQVVEVRERVEEIAVTRVVEVAEPPVLTDYAASDLSSWGVPEDWIEDVLAATDSTILDVVAHLPEEAQEAVLRAASGEPPLPVSVAFATGLDHPDARRRFRVIGDQAELEAALDAPWDEWTIFLHPAQQAFVDRDFSGPARVVGSAGTGKTVVALHRAARLAREGGRVLLSTFSPDLAADLRMKVDRLAGGAEWADRVEVDTMDTVVSRLLPGGLRLANSNDVNAALETAAKDIADAPSLNFLADEWRLIVDAWAIPDAETYRDLPRLGRGVRLPAARREAVWEIFASTRTLLEDHGMTTPAAAMHDVATKLRSGELKPPYDHVVMDEAQDIGPAELTLLAAMAGDQPNGLFFAGDIGQRIFRAPFPWSHAGIAVRGRSATLKVNYRTSHEIRSQTETLLPRRLVESDGEEEDRGGVVSTFHGIAPVLKSFPTMEAECDAAVAWATARLDEGIVGEELAILVRSEAEQGRAEAVAKQLDSLPRILQMHDAKGREFRAVVLLACDADVIPSEDRLADATDERTMAEVFETERHLLYVAATRAREAVWISGVEPVSEFLSDMMEPT